MFKAFDASSKIVPLNPTPPARVPFTKPTPTRNHLLMVRWSAVAVSWLQAPESRIEKQNRHISTMQTVSLIGGLHRKAGHLISCFTASGSWCGVGLATPGTNYGHSVWSGHWALLSAYLASPCAPLRLCLGKFPKLVLRQPEDSKLCRIIKLGYIFFVVKYLS